MSNWVYMFFNGCFINYVLTFRACKKYIDIWMPDCSHYNPRSRLPLNTKKGQFNLQPHLKPLAKAVVPPTFISLFLKAVYHHLLVRVPGFMLK